MGGCILFCLLHLQNYLALPSIIPPSKDPVRHVSDMFSRVQGQTEPNSEPTELTWKWGALLTCSCVRCTGGPCAWWTVGCVVEIGFLTPLKEKKTYRIPGSSTLLSLYPFFLPYIACGNILEPAAPVLGILLQPVIPAFPHEWPHLITGCGGEQGQTQRSPLILIGRSLLTLQHWALWP